MTFLARGTLKPEGRSWNDWRVCGGTACCLLYMVVKFWEVDLMGVERFSCLFDNSGEVFFVYSFFSVGKLYNYEILNGLAWWLIGTLYLKMSCWTLKPFSLLRRNMHCCKPSLHVVRTVPKYLNASTWSTTWAFHLQWCGSADLWLFDSFIFFIDPLCINPFSLHEPTWSLFQLSYRNI